MLGASERMAMIDGAKKLYAIIFSDVYLESKVNFGGRQSPLSPQFCAGTSDKMIFVSAAGTPSATRLWTTDL